MYREIRIKKGLNVPLQGQAQRQTLSVPLSNTYALAPDDFQHVIPKLEVREGEEIKAGSPLFRSKSDARIVFPSPVSGEVVEIKRGDKRRIIEIKILTDRAIDFIEHGPKNPAEMSPEQIKEHLLHTGCWPLIRQRPYDVIAHPDKAPKALFISSFSTAPLAPDPAYVFQENEAQIRTAIEALKKLSPGKVHIGLPGEGEKTPFHSLEGVEFHRVYGPHPAGNVGVQIAQVDPINKGEVVWVLHPQDLVIIGELFLSGRWNPERLLALTGSQIEAPCYIKARIGAQISDLIQGEIKGSTNRYISGDVFTGTQVDQEGYLRYYSDQITVVPEGDEYDLLGWLLPQPKKFSVSRANLFSWLRPKKRYALNTNLNGEERTFVFTGLYEKYFPFDIYPIQLLKAIMTQDIDKMEQLGIYEVAPEDFALTEFVDPCKQPHQEIVRKGLEWMIKEVG